MNVKLVEPESDFRVVGRRWAEGYGAGKEGYWLLPRQLKLSDGSYIEFEQIKRGDYTAVAGQQHLLTRTTRVGEPDEHVRAYGCHRIAPPRSDRQGPGSMAIHARRTRLRLPSTSLITVKVKEKPLALHRGRLR